MPAVEPRIHYTLTLFYMAEYWNIRRAADAGDEVALSLIAAFIDWGQAAKTQTPICFDCAAKVAPENFGGLAVFRPEAHAVKSTPGIRGAFCRACEDSRTSDELAMSAYARMRQTVNFELLSVH